MSYQLFRHDKPLSLESGTVIPSYHLAYTTHGRLNAAKNNAVWVFHALTANSDPAEWWPGLVGKGKLFDPASHFIVCVNMPGSCYGSISPLDIDPEKKETYYHSFPFFTPRDMIHAYQPLKNFLEIERIHAGIGGSMGGQQLLEWAVEEPDLFEFIFPIATNAQHSPWGIAFNTAQRMAIETDNSWKEKHSEAGLKGMKAARAMALLSYRDYNTYLNRQPRSNTFPFGETMADGKLEQNWDGASSYQRYQGEKLARRFNAYSYYVLSQSMDAHNVGRGRGTVQKALQKVKAKALVIGIDTDILFPVAEQQLIADLIPGAHYESIDSLYGHDGFLLEFDAITKLIHDFLILKNRKPLLPTV